MLFTAFFPFISFILSLFPPIFYLPLGVVEALSWFVSVSGYINIFVPLLRVVPILALIMFIRNFHIMNALARFIMRFIPGISGG